MGRGDERVLRMALRNVLRATSHEDALGVTRGCPAADVTEAYRDMAILCHPDKVAAGLRGDAGVAMSRLNAARDALLSKSRETAPPPQRLRVVARSATSLDLAWDGAGPFELQWRPASSQNWLGTRLTGNACRKKNLAGGVSYTFRVRAAAGSAWSRVVAGTTLRPAGDEQRRARAERVDAKRAAAAAARAEAARQEAARRLVAERERLAAMKAQAAARRVAAARAGFRSAASGAGEAVPLRSRRPRLSNAAPPRSLRRRRSDAGRTVRRGVPPKSSSWRAEKRIADTTHRRRKSRRRCAPQGSPRSRKRGRAAGRARDAARGAPRRSRTRRRRRPLRARAALRDEPAAEAAAAGRGAARRDAPGDAAGAGG